LFHHKNFFFVSFCFIRLKARGGRAFPSVPEPLFICVGAVWLRCYLLPQHLHLIRPPALTPALPSTRLRLVTAGSVGSASAPLFVGECTVVRCRNVLSNGRSFACVEGLPASKKAGRHSAWRSHRCTPSVNTNVACLCAVPGSLVKFSSRLLAASEDNLEGVKVGHAPPGRAKRDAVERFLPVSRRWLDRWLDRRSRCRVSGTPCGRPVRLSRLTDP
jgi:hypothetical protein